MGGAWPDNPQQEALILSLFIIRIRFPIIAVMGPGPWPDKVRTKKEQQECTGGGDPLTICCKLPGRRNRAFPSAFTAEFPSHPITQHHNTRKDQHHIIPFHSLAAKR
jgi:hypothetical protein